MNLLYVILVGGAIGALNGVLIFFVKEEPYKLEVFVATTLRNILVALLTGFSIENDKGRIHALMFGALYGLLSAASVFLAKGGFRSKGHWPIIIFGTTTGALIGVIISRFLL